MLIPVVPRARRGNEVVHDVGPCHAFVLLPTGPGRGETTSDCAVSTRPKVPREGGGLRAGRGAWPFFPSRARETEREREKSGKVKGDRERQGKREREANPRERARERESAGERER